MKKRILFSLVIACFVFIFVSNDVISQTTRTSRRLPDLQVKFTAPITIMAGTDIGPHIKLKVWNAGNAVARGTDTAGQNGYMVDVMLSTDTTTPGGWATYSPNFHEDVLLKGGRISNTVTLNPGQSKQYPTGGGIPFDAPKGGCYICAKVDSGNKIVESNEGNNVFCQRVYIRPLPIKVKDDCKKIYPNPRIKFDHVDADGRVYIPVINWAVYDNQMFRKAPDLPPCGLNINSARTWVDIYDGKTGNRIYGFCALGVKEDLRRIWFMPRGVKAGIVYIVMHDRACKKKYKSNRVKWHL